MPFDVEMPDGTLIEDVPDGITQAELQRRYGAMSAPRKRSRVSELVNASMPQLAGGYGLDVIMGGKQVLDAAAQMVVRATGWGVQDTEAANQRTLDAYNSSNPEGRPGAGLMRGVGQALLMAPLTPAAAVTTLPRALGMGGAAGGAASALTPVYEAGDDFWARKAEQAGEGAVIGAATGGVGHGLGRMLAPETGAAQRAMLDEGVPLTPGQVLGGAWNRFEEGLSSVPFVGDMMKGARRKAVEGFNRMGYNRALEPIGEKAGADFPVGYKGIDAVAGKLSNAYEAVLDKIKIVKIDERMGRQVGNVVDMADQAGIGDKVRAIVKQQVQDKMTPAGTVSADTMKVIESQLGGLRRDLRNASTYEDIKLREAVAEIQDALRSATERASPMYAPLLQKVNKGYAEYKRLEDAAAARTSLDGIFTPETYRGSVHRMASKAERGHGKALGQDFATDAVEVLGRQVPDSGTPYRTLAALAASGAIEPNSAALGTLAMLPYTQAGRKASEVLIAGQRPEPVISLGEAMKRLSPYAAAPFGSLSPSLWPRQ